MNNDMHGNRALIIGVGADLPQTVLDANKTAAIFADPTRCAFLKTNVVLVTQENAKRDNILTALDALASETGNVPSSTVVVYFSGHGLHVQNDNVDDYYLAPFGYDTK